MLNRSINSVNIFIETAFSHLTTTRNILRVGQGVEFNWDAKFTNYFIEESKLSSNFKKFKES